MIVYPELKCFLYLSRLLLSEMTPKPIDLLTKVLLIELCETLGFIVVQSTGQPKNTHCTSLRIVLNVSPCLIPQGFFYKICDKFSH